MASISSISNKIRDVVKKLDGLQPTPWIFTAIATSFYAIRSWEYIIKAQLYAEDGHTWLANGYNLSITSIVTPLNGFLHVPERVFGYIVALLPLQFAPFLFNITALFIFAVMTYYLFSPRTNILGSMYEKVFVLASLCLIANVDEFFFNFSNSIFLLGIIGLLLIVAKQPKQRSVDWFEKGLFTLSCLTLPFAWLYLPMLLIEKLQFKRSRNYFLVVAAIGSLLQGIAYLTSHAERSSVTFKALFTSRYTILEIYNQIVVPAMRFARLDVIPQRLSLITAFFVVFVAALLYLFVFIKANRQVRYLLVFVVLMTAASLKSPIIASNNPYTAIEYMSQATGGDRYFIFGIIGMYVVLAKVTYASFKTGALYPFLVIYIGLGVITSIQTKSFIIDKQFLDHREAYRTGIRQLQDKNNTQPIWIPENPIGWSITLEPK